MVLIFHDPVYTITAQDGVSFTELYIDPAPTILGFFFNDQNTMSVVQSTMIHDLI